MLTDQEMGRIKFIHLHASFNISFNRCSARELILKAAERIYALITEDTKDTFPPLMLDSAS